MSFRLLIATLMTASLLFATSCYAEPAAVRGSRSNGSEKTQTKQTGDTGRMTVTGSGTQTTSAKTTARMGAGGGGKGAVQLNPQPEPPGRR